MEIKYEAVFGQQELFDGMMGDCEFASEEYGYIFANGVLYYCERYNEKAGWSLSCKNHLTFKPSAMRRIIRTPTWTVEDQKAVRLPEVGAKYNVDGCEVKHLGVGAAGYEDIFHFEYPSGACGCSNKIFIKPIETPEEKAARLREEWVDNATFMTTYEIYDKLLSGDLPVPVKEQP